MLITTTFTYGLRDEDKEFALKMFKVEDINTYQDIFVTDKEYMKYWYLFDKIKSVREEIVK